MGMTVVTIEPHHFRPRLWRAIDAWSEHEVRPCGVRGELGWLGPPPAPDLSDCLVARPRPHLLAICEPIITKAPGPHLAQPWCCYINTVIFYHRPYIVRPWRKIYESRGRLTHCSPGFEEWDQIKTRFTWDECVSFKGDVFQVSGGRVLWANAPGEPRRWWMRRGARRIRQELSA